MVCIWHTTRFYKNSLKKPKIFELCKNHSSINSFVKGVMIESYIEDGNQPVGGGVYGKSITDPCLGWDKTEKLILELAEQIRKINSED